MMQGIYFMLVEPMPCKYKKALVFNSDTVFDSGCNDVRWRPGQEASLAPPYSNFRSLERKCTVLKKVLVTLLGLFGAPSSHSAPEEL